MDEELKFLAKTSCHLVEKGNFLKLLINRENGELNLCFRKKPAVHIRNDLRFIGFSWSRKNRYWQSFLNKTQIRRVSKFYKTIIKTSRNYGKY